MIKTCRTTHAAAIIGNVPIIANANTLPMVSVVDLSELLLRITEDGGAAAGVARS